MFQDSCRRLIMLKFDVKRKINTLRDILVGKVPDPKAQVEQITIAMIYKFMDDMDIEAMEFGGERVFFKEEYEKYAWSNLMSYENSGQQRALVYAEGIDKMSMNPHIPQLFRDIFRGAYIPYRDPETLNMFLKEIGEFSYDNSEDLGNAFEYLLMIMGSQGEAGQFRTPRHIIDMMVEIVNPKKNDTILDPACGTAGFLISAYKHILKTNVDENGKSTLNSDDKKRLTENFAGYDISPDMVRLARVNMYLHRFTKPQISEYDTLSSDEKWDENYDVILANPPFMTPKGGIIPHNRYRVKAKRAEVLFVDYIAEHLNPTGKAAIIVPEGIVFQSATAYKELRKYLVDDGLLYAVISLPAGVFNPYSGVKTSILLIDKPLARMRDDILFVKMNHDGFDLGAQRREIKQNDIPDIINAVKAYQNSEEINNTSLVTLADKKDIAEQDYILVGERYKQDKFTQTKWNTMKLCEVCDLLNGYAFKSSDYVEHSNTLNFRMSNIRPDGNVDLTYAKKYLPDEYVENYSEYVLSSGDVVIAMTDMASDPKILGVPTIIPDSNNKLLLNQRVGKFININTEILHIPFLKYVLNCSIVKDYYKSLSGGGLQINLSKKDLLKLSIPIPPLFVQKEIVEEIESYQKIIDGAKQVVYNYTPTISINADWETDKIDNLVEFVSGVTLSVGECESADGVPLITIADVTENGYLDLSNIRKVETSKKVNTLQKGDLLFNWRNGSKNLVGKTALFDLDGEYIFASFLLGIRPDKNKIDSEFLWVLLNQYRVQGKYMQFMRQNVNGLFNREELKEVYVPVPSLEEQQEIMKRIKEEMAIVEQNKRLIEIFEQKISDKISEVWGD